MKTTQEKCKEKWAEEKTHHRGVDDSKNIATILVHMLKKIRG